MYNSGLDGRAFRCQIKLGISYIYSTRLWSFVACHTQLELNPLE